MPNTFDGEWYSRSRGRASQQEGATLTDAVPAHHPFRSAAAMARYLSAYDAWASTWPVESTILEVTTPSTVTFIRASGPVDAPPLVLLPGSWDTSLMWRELVVGFSADHRVFAVDNPFDFGRGHPLTPSKHVDYMAWLDELLDGLGLDSGMDLMGCSFGAWLACAYTLHAPARLAHSVWLSPPLVTLGPNASIAVVGETVSMLAFLAPSRGTVGMFMRWLMPDAVDAPWFNDYLDQVLLGLKCFKPVLATSEPRVLTDAELSGIDVPVLYIVGEDDPMAQATRSVARLGAVAPRIRTRVVTGASHELGVGEPDAVLREVSEFLGRRPPVEQRHRAERQKVDST